ncbi:hypothetical protein EYF80_011619 [Liparis tanakae]|uniref:Uncharacterized protein n=1 Tax=Liparis tanakae TaxID=230148 RepID=A0A4Z2IKV4_9TELE|nr:hypothetical protein EYF80_011619 [Liparis tanakae]
MAPRQVDETGWMFGWEVEEGAAVGVKLAVSPEAVWSLPPSSLYTPWVSSGSQSGEPLLQLTEEWQEWVDDFLYFHILICSILSTVSDIDVTIDCSPRGSSKRVSSITRWSVGSLVPQISLPVMMT